MTDYPRYPQLSFDRSPVHQVSPDLAAMVVGKFDFDGMDHHARVMSLSALIKLYNLVRDLGDLEHTGDWDWRIQVVWGDAKFPVPNPPDDDPEPEDFEDTMCDVLTLNYEVEPNDYINRFARWNYLTIEVYAPTGEHGETHDVLVPIDEIRYITIEEL